MNKLILDKYQIRFNLLKLEGRKEIQVSSVIIPQLSGYLIKCHPEFLSEEIIPEINNAIAGKPFDEEGGGFYCSLTIGEDVCKIGEIYNTEQTIIPTGDLKEILMSYIDWINSNNYAQHI